MNETGLKQGGYPVQWDLSTATSKYATNMLVQSAENEFFLSFFEIVPPLIFGAADRERVEFVRAECVARVIVPLNKVQDFIDAMQQTLNAHNAAREEGNKDDDSNDTDS